MKLKLTFIQSVAASTLVVAAAVIGCQNPDYPAAQPSTAGYNTTATRVLFVNATPDAASLKLSVDNTLAGTLTPGTSTSYVGVQSGSAANASPQIRVNGAGGTLTSDLVTKGVLAANTAYTIFVTDSINRPKGTGTDLGGIRTLQVVDTLTTPAAGTAKVRFFNLAPDVSTASARLTNPASTSSVATLTNRAYRATAAASLRYTTVPAGPYVTQVYSGTAVPSSLTATPATSTTLTLTDGKIYTIYAKGLNRTKTLSVGTIQHN